MRVFGLVLIVACCVLAVFLVRARNELRAARDQHNQALGRLSVAERRIAELEKTLVAERASAQKLARALAVHSIEVDVQFSQSQDSNASGPRQFRAGIVALLVLSGNETIRMANPDLTCNSLTSETAQPIVRCLFVPNPSEMIGKPLSVLSKVEKIVVRRPDLLARAGASIDLSGSPAAIWLMVNEIRFSVGNIPAVLQMENAGASGSLAYDVRQFFSGFPDAYFAALLSR